ncbi:uncharacterized protein N7479_007554 [Penicillium vulpinum]|uniref:Uncharacterized protein n=1 Tax=Penicillium vulpinum TaxID=29845 RepID=A0A1V6S9X0_9EURO|nr:uncharacterized protein N7479_007554 [Penicillium vulpinum]KAJ5960404.1 hypothetical protein N7479_007554 [Penicillium vulpinum]OQE10842.1 hypothetical protein PENVUL_c003G02980 [Penicillium vulpinum]
MFITQSPQTPFRQTHYAPIHSSPLSKHNTTPPAWTMSPTRNIHKSASQSTTPNLFSNPPPAFNIQTEPITRHTQNHHSPIPMHFNASASASTTPTSSNPFLMPTQTPTSPSSPTRQKPRYEARYASKIANPLQGAAGLARSKTRKMFLNRVRHERDDGRFEARGEQMMHMEYIADRRRWEESMARDGEGVVGVFEGEVDEDDMLPDDADVLHEFISQEEAIEMALRETQSAIPERVHHLRNDGPGVQFSDDEYDDIFMGLSDPRVTQSESQDMDMS